jgi:Arc/MetJ-type ribon-helix-helix transcriptional regulator
MLDEFFDKKLIEWTPEKIRKEIQEGDYLNRVDLKNKNINLYAAANRRSMLGEFFDKKWTPEKIRKAIEEGDYKGRVDLSNKNPNLYSAALRRNMLGEFFNKKNLKWTPEKIRQSIEEGSYVNRSDLERRNSKLYQAAYKNNMLDEFFGIRTPTPGRIQPHTTKWSPEKIRKEIEEGGYSKKSDLKGKNQKLYQAALKRNMLDEFFNKKNVGWTPEKIRQVIEEGGYESRSDLRYKNQKLYNALERRNMLDMLDEFFPKKLIEWTPEKIREEFIAGNYLNKNDLRASNSKLYRAALKRNMLDELFDKKTDKT